MTAWLFLAGAALLGVALVGRALPRVLTGAERALWGLVVGWSLSTALAYAVALSLGHLTAGSMSALAGTICLAALLLLWPEIKRLGRERVRAALRAENVYLSLLLVLFAPAYSHLFRTHLLQPGADGAIYSGGSAWYDMALHAAITTSFLHGQNFPPVYTIFPPAPLLYPFLPDFQTAVLMSLGMDMHTALVSTSIALALALTGIVYTFALRLLRAWNDSSFEVKQQFAPRAAALAALLFLLNGGLGFIYFFYDWRQSGRSFAETWSRLDINYANMGDRQIQWTNLVTDTFLPQRASLFGIPLALIVFTLFAVCWRSWHDKDEQRTQRRGWRVLLFAGAIAGALPIFHTHSYVAVGLVSVLLFLLQPRRAWLAFWLPAVLLAFPRFASLASHVAGSSFIRFQLGWRAPRDASWLLFWLKNLGVPLILVVPAFLSAPRAWQKFYLAFTGLFAFSLVVVLSPNDYDNIKLIYYWYAATCVMIASWLMSFAATKMRSAFAILLVVLSIASGLLALRFESLSRKPVFNREETAAADFARLKTPPRSLFLTAPTVHQPIVALAGRATLRGDTAWLWSHGYPFAEREADVRRIYRGAGDALELIDYYRIDYIYFSARERSFFKANESFFEKNFPVVFRNQGVTIYDARRAGNTRDNQHAFAAFAPREYASRLDKDASQLLVEFPRVAFALYRLYLTSMGREPQFKEFMSDIKALGSGVYVGAGSWQEKLEENRRRLASELVARTEFAGKAAMTDEEFIDALYSNIKLTTARDERERLLSELRNGQTTRASALIHVSENRALYRREYDRAYLLMHYFGYLRRNPADAPDLNLEGFNFWLEILERTNDYASVTRVFIESGEYKDRVNSEQ